MISVVEIKKILFNDYVEHAWRLYLGVAWSKKTLKLACDAREKDDDENFSKIMKDSNV